MAYTHYSKILQDRPPRPRRRPPPAASVPIVVILPDRYPQGLAFHHRFHRQNDCSAGAELQTPPEIRHNGVVSRGGPAPLYENRVDL